MTPTLPKTAYIRGKSCKNCSGPIPKPKNNKAGNIRRKTFCGDNCRKEFHKNNGISVHKLKEQVQTWVAKELDPLQRSINELGVRLSAIEKTKLRRVRG